MTVAFFAVYLAFFYDGGGARLQADPHNTVVRVRTGSLS